MSPFNAFTFIQGLETFPLRMERHCENAKKVAEFLENNKKFLGVIYLSLMEAKYLNRAKKYLKRFWSFVRF